MLARLLDNRGIHTGVLLRGVHGGPLSGHSTQPGQTEQATLWHACDAISVRVHVCNFQRDPNDGGELFTERRGVGTNSGERVTLSDGGGKVKAAC